MAAGGLPIIDSLSQCIHCNELFEIDIEDCRSSVEYNLDFMSDTVEGYEIYNEYYFDTANVPCDINCPHCEKKFESVAQVTARPVWNDDEILEGREPRICYFEDVEILNISSSFEKTTSIQEGFKLHIENHEDFEFNTQHALDSNLVPSSITLKIIAKTKMSRGFCYLGLDERTDRIFRPIFNTEKCCWPKNEQLQFGMMYTFSVISHPDQCNSLRDLLPSPHRNEDMIVNGFSILETPATGGNSLYPSFLQMAKSDVDEVFNAIRSRKYVDEKTECSSAGIIRSEARIIFDDYMKKDYCNIRCPSGLYSFPITASQFDDIGAEYRDAVVILGLGRPYKGRRGQHDPARCFVLAVGIFLPNV